MERTWTGIWIKAYSGYASMKPLQPSPYMRTVFHATEKVQSAIVHLCALGVHQLYINDQIVDGDSWYKPALSQYDCRAGYLDYDVKKYLKPGKNVLIVQLGNGFYNAYNNWMYTTNYVSWRGAPRMICDVEIDGKIIEFSGVHWRVHSSPITFDCHHEGEDYDAAGVLADMMPAIGGRATVPWWNIGWKTGTAPGHPNSTNRLRRPPDGDFGINCSCCGNIIGRQAPC